MQRRPAFLALFIVLAAATCGASKNDAEAIFQEGRSHLRGGADTFSLEKAAERFAVACQRGHQFACTNLALQLQDGRGVPRDLTRAIALYEAACDAGAGIGCMNRAFMLQGGMGDDDDPVRALAFFKRAETALKKSCDAGDLQWCTNLGVLYEDDFLGKPDPVRAAAVYQKACDQRVGDWCVNLALLSLYGHLPDAKPDAALALLEKTCAAKSSQGCGALGKMLVVPPSGDGADIPRGLTLLDGACTDGEVQACATLGAVLGMGQLVPRDVPRAEAAQTRACLLGDSNACHVLALARAEDGRPAEAVPWLERGCNIGGAASCALLAAFVEAGQGATADPARALSLFNDACRLGDRRACVELLERAKPLPLSAEHRRQFLDEACEHGIDQACKLRAP